MPPPPIGDRLKWFHEINFRCSKADRGSSKQNELISVVDLPICLFAVQSICLNMLAMVFLSYNSPCHCLDAWNVWCNIQYRRKPQHHFVCGRRLAPLFRHVIITDHLFRCFYCCCCCSFTPNYFLASFFPFRQKDHHLIPFVISFEMKIDNRLFWLKIGPFLFNNC